MMNGGMIDHKILPQFQFAGKFSRFKNSLPPNLALTPNRHYDMRYSWRHSGKPKDFAEAQSMEEPMFSLEDDGLFHGLSVQGNTGRFLKPKDHPSLQMELDWYYGNTPEAIDFRSKNDLNKRGKYYRYVPKYQFAGPFGVPKRVQTQRYDSFQSPRTQAANLNSKIKGREYVDRKKASEDAYLTNPNQVVIRPGEERGIVSKAIAIAANPITAASYLVKGQRIPDYFDRGATSNYDIGISIVNPINAISDLNNASGDFNTGNYLSAGMNLASGLTSLPSIPAWTRQATNPKLRYALKESLKEPIPINNRATNFAEILALATADGVAPLMTKTPRLNDIYKKLAYSIGQKSSGNSSLTVGNVLRNAFGNKKVSRYTGADYTGIGSREPGNRDLLRQYIYGDSPGFEPSDLQPRGLNKYYDKYGDMSVYKLDSEIPDGKLVEVDFGDNFRKRTNDAVDLIGGLDVAQRKGVSFGLEEAHLNPIKPNDDIAGHMVYLDTDPENVLKLTTQDIWKFTPEDYVQRYGKVNSDGLMDPEHYKTYLQAKLMERAGKPFILMQQNPLKFINKKTPVFEPDADMYGVTDEDILKSIQGMKIIEKRKGGPIISSRGQWDYPGQRTIVPTPNGRITMKGVPYPVYGQDETGYGQMMMPGGEYEFPGQMVYETPMMQKGGALPTYQTKGQVQPLYVDNPNDSRIQKYQDSLVLYNNTKGMIDELKAFENYYGDTKQGGNKNLFVDQWMQYTKDWYKNKGPKVRPAFNRLSNRNKKAPLPYKTYESKLSPYQVAVEYKKPVQPVVFQEKPKEVATIDYSRDRNIDIPNIQMTAPRLEQKQTSYMYSYPTFDDRKQNVLYFPDEQSFKKFTDERGYLNRQISPGQGQATGYLNYRYGGIPMMQKGGERDPIYVTDKRDPRLIRYTDSLNLYNQSLSNINTLINRRSQWADDPATRAEQKKLWRGVINKELRNSSEYPYSDWVREQMKKNPKDLRFFAHRLLSSFNQDASFGEDYIKDKEIYKNKVVPNILPKYRIQVGEGDNEATYIPIYKKPVQPVIYQDREIESINKQRRSRDLEIPQRITVSTRFPKDYSAATRMVEFNNPNISGGLYGGGHRRLFNTMKEADDFMRYIQENNLSYPGTTVENRAVLSPDDRREFEYGGPLPQYQGDKTGSTVDASREFLKNWYTNRKFADPKIQQAYNLDRPVYLQNIGKMPSYTFVDNIQNDPTVHGEYVPRTNQVLITKKAPGFVKTHELNHYINVHGNAGKNMAKVHRNLVGKSTYSPSQLGQYFKPYAVDYLLDPDEIHSRIMTLRQKSGFKPDEVITPERLKTSIQKYMSGKESNVDIESLLNAVNGPEGLLNLLNNMASTRTINPVLNIAKTGGQHGGLDRWFAEKWVDIKTGKPCGRQEGDGRSYPACRPSKRVSSETPKTASELSSSEREKFKRSKTSSERINYQHRRK